MSGNEAEVVGEAEAFLRRLGSAGSHATVLSVLLAGDPPGVGDARSGGASVGLEDAAELPRSSAPEEDQAGEAATRWTSQVVEELAERLEPLIRATDLLRHLGAGEFLLVVSSGGELPSAALADRVRGVAALPFSTESGDFSLALHVGVASCAPDREDPTVVIEAARSDARNGR